MTSPFRGALATVRGQSRLDNLARSSLRAAEAKFAPRLAEPLLRVELGGQRMLGAFDTATVSMAVQAATAKLAHIIRDPDSERTQTRKSDREEALLVPRAQLGRTMLFGFPPPLEGLETSMFDDVRTPSLSESAALELCSILPGSANDDAAIDALISQRTTVRSAIGDIAEAVNSVLTGIELDLVVEGRDPVHSVVSVDQAEILRETLRETRTDRRVEHMVGRLDGVRTRRRIFYLELETGEEIHGAIGPEDPHLMNRIRDNLDRLVTAKVETERVETLGGRRGRPTYRLVDLSPQAGLFSAD